MPWLSLLFRPDFCVSPKLLSLPVHDRRHGGCWRPSSPLTSAPTTSLQRFRRTARSAVSCSSIRPVAVGRILPRMQWRLSLPWPFQLVPLAFQSGDSGIGMGRRPVSPVRRMFPASVAASGVFGLGSAGRTGQGRPARRPGAKLPCCAGRHFQAVSGGCRISLNAISLLVPFRGLARSLIDNKMLYKAIKVS
jgi:hypothetical protein